MTNTNPHRATVLAALKICDLVVVALVFVLALWWSVHGSAPLLDVLEVRIKLRNFAFFALYLATWHVLLHWLGLYRSYRLSPSAREWRDLASVVVLGVLPLVLLRGVLRFEFAGPEFLVTFPALALVGLGVERRMLRALARLMRRQGRNLRGAVIVGDGDAALDMASRLARRADLGYHVVALLELAPGADAGERRRGIARLLELFDQQPIDEVFVALPLDAGQPLIREILARSEERGVTVRLVSSVADPLLAKAQVDEVDGRPVISIYTGPPDSLPIAMKRLMDVSIAAVLLVVLSPLLGAVALLVKLDSAGPVLFAQDRVGLNRRRFMALKFRTMVAGADQQQAGLESSNEAEGPVFKIRRDPRVTRVGRWLRRMSLDELPQLWNVLKGEMSLVGPRPLPLRDVGRIDVAAQKRRFSVRPGMTCLWQIRSREPRFAEWVKADMEYIDNWSVALDVEILMKTIPAVLSGRGAY
jgi:exopolysaccharide biosynthesis polyprenyl glycosylphosphotransferase